MGREERQAEAARVTGRRLYEFDHHPTADHRRCTLQAGKSDVVPGIKQAVHLRATRLKQSGHPRLRYFLFSHSLGDKTSAASLLLFGKNKNVIWKAP